MKNKPRLQQMFDSKINWLIVAHQDAGFIAHLGDDLVGYDVIEYFPTYAQAEDFIWAMGRCFYPEAECYKQNPNKED
jgi:hypothetical protein